MPRLSIVVVARHCHPFRSFYCLSWSLVVHSLFVLLDCCNYQLTNLTFSQLHCHDRQFSCLVFFLPDCFSRQLSNLVFPRFGIVAGYGPNCSLLLYRHGHDLSSTIPIGCDIHYGRAFHRHGSTSAIAKIHTGSCPPTSEWVLRPFRKAGTKACYDGFTFSGRAQSFLRPLYLRNPQMT